MARSSKRRSRSHRLLCALMLVASPATAEESEESVIEPVYKLRPSGRMIFERKEPRIGVTVHAQVQDATKIAPGVYQSEGNSNSWLLVTKEGRIVINTGMGFEGPIHRANFDAVDDGPIRYIIFTQGHVDHVGGTPAFLEEGTKIIAQAGNQSHQGLDKLIDGYRGRRARFAFPEEIAIRRDQAPPPGGRPPAPQAAPVPDITFEDRYAFSLGGLEVELIWIPGGETNDSLVVWLPRQRIAIVGNLFGALFGHVPNLVTIRGDKYRDSQTFSRAIERVRALEPEILALGHYEPLRGAQHIREQLDHLHAAVAYVHDETVRYMNEGKDVYTAMAEIELPPELDVGEGYGKVAWNVRAIWENYVGWFHHLSTTELYPQPPSSIYPDLVEMAGRANVVTGAQKRLESGDAVEAIHLAEAVLAVAPDDRDALTVYRDAHVVLEAKSENFWEISWLRDQIRRTNEQLGGDD